jgi:hypothetical protein
MSNNFINQLPLKFQDFWKKNFNQAFLKRFLLGFLLMPWILIWGWFSTLVILCIWFLSSPIYTNSSPILASRLEAGLAYPTILLLSGISYFLFYCINFTISTKYRWTKYLILITTFYSLIILSLQFYPYFVILLQTSA